MAGKSGDGMLWHICDGMATPDVVACCILDVLADVQGSPRPDCGNSASSRCNARHERETATSAAGPSSKASPCPLTCRPLTRLLLYSYLRSLPANRQRQRCPMLDLACCCMATCTACLCCGEPAPALRAACADCHGDPAPNRRAPCGVQATAAPRRRLDGPAGCCTATATASWSWATHGPWSRATCGLWIRGSRPPQWGPSSRKPSSKLATLSRRRM